MHRSCEWARYVAAVETALRRARMLERRYRSSSPEKGRGYKPAEKDIADRFHARWPDSPGDGAVAPERWLDRLRGRDLRPGRDAAPRISLGLPPR